MSDKGAVAKRYHGLQLQEAWDGEGLPPVLRAPPFLGLPALEINHPFHFKMTPSMMLGPKCNHDLSVLLRLLVEGVNTKEAAVSGMLDAMGDHEYYCASYAGKEQPHIDGLLQTLQDGLRAKELDLATAREAGEEVDACDAARQVLHRLVSSTNKRMHKGFPEMLTYLLGKPMEYCSHEFVHVMLDVYLRTAHAAFYCAIGLSSSDGTKFTASDEGGIRVSLHRNPSLVLSLIHI